MADGPTTEYKPQGDGPHPTLAGNVLDPGVSADGKMSAGQGVGGTDESTIKQEGMEHIRSNVPGTQQVSGGLGTDGTTEPGLAGDSSQTAQSGGMMDTVKSYLGMGGAATKPPERETSGLGSENVDPNMSSTRPSMGETSNLGSESVDPKMSTAEPAMDETRNLGSDGIDPKSTSTGGEALAAGGAGAAAAGTDRSLDGTSDRATSSTPGAMGEDTITSSNDPASNTTANLETPTDSNVNTGAPPTESADPTTKDTAQSETVEKTPAPAKSSNKGLENKDAIPTAGGEKLGAQHWGESGIVPDNPKPKTEEGVSGKDGQSNKQTAENTAKNTGDPHHSGSSGDGGKEGLVDKIKDKLHIGGKNKE